VRNFALNFKVSIRASREKFDLTNIFASLFVNLPLYTPSPCKLAGGEEKFTPQIVNTIIPILLMCEVNTIRGFNTLFNVVLPRAGIEICPSPSINPAK